MSRFLRARRLSKDVLTEAWLAPDMLKFGGNDMVDIYKNLDCMYTYDGR